MFHVKQSRSWKTAEKHAAGDLKAATPRAKKGDVSRKKGDVSRETICARIASGLEAARRRKKKASKQGAEHRRTHNHCFT